MIVLEKAAEVKRFLWAFELASQEKHGNSHAEIQEALKQQEVWMRLISVFPRFVLLTRSIDY